MRLSAAKHKERELHDAKLAEAYDKKREKDPIGRRYQGYWLARILSHSHAGETPRVLDYCCGTSMLYPHLKKSYPAAEYVGIDLSSEMLAVGNQRYGREPAETEFRLFQRDGEDLRLNERFDLVIARGAIHHLPNPAKGLREIAKVLKQDGTLVISEPAANPLLKAVRWVLYRLSSHFSSSHRSFTYGQLMRIMDRAGFEVLACERFGFLAYPFGFPDIIPFSKLMPHRLFPSLIRVDELIGKVPVVRALSFTVIVVARPRQSRSSRGKRRRSTTVHDL